MPLTGMQQNICKAGVLLVVDGTHHIEPALSVSSVSRCAPYTEQAGVGIEGVRLVQAKLGDVQKESMCVANAG